MERNVEEIIPVLESMSLEDLQVLKNLWYRKAQKNGDIAKCYLIGRELGERKAHKYGPKYSFQESGINIFVDDYGNYMTVHINGKLTVSTHPCEKLFIIGSWMDKIRVFAEEAQAKKDLSEKSREEKERQKLIDELSL